MGRGKKAIQATAASAVTGAPVVFVHGLWLHATSWDPWAELFAGAGHAPIVAGWPGEPDTVAEARRNPEAVAGHGVGDVVAHFARIADAQERRPIVIGHSFGGLVAQRLLAEGHAAAAVAIDPAPMRGIVVLPPSALRVASVALRNPANRKRAVALTGAQFRYGFANAVSEQECAELYERWTVPSPGRPLFEAAGANLAPSSPARVDTARADRGPLLITAGGRDHAVPARVARAAYRRYRRSPAITELREFPDRGHSLIVDSGWREVAQTALDWLRDRGV